MEFKPFDFGQVIQTAEAVKKLRRDDTLDKLREKYLGIQIQGAQEKDAREAAQFNDAQRKANTEWLVGATDQLLHPQLDDASRMTLAQQLVVDGKRRGIIAPDYDVNQGFSLEGLKQLNQQAKIALGTLPKSNLPTEVQEFEYGQRNPEFAQRQLELKKAGSTKVEVNTGQKFEDAASKAAGEATGKAFAAVKERANTAAEELDTLRALRASPAATGPGAESMAFTTQLASQLRIPVSEAALKNAANVGQYGAAVSAMVLNRQLAQKGPQTESDAKRIQNTLSKTSNIRDVNNAILNYNIAVKEREVQMAEFAEAYRQDTGKIDGWEKSWRQYMRENPLVMNHEKTGSLVFYHQFRDLYREKNPTATDQQIQEAWRSVSGK